MWKSHKTCLTNHTGSISHHIMPLVINVHGKTYTHISKHKQKQFQETRRVWFKKVKSIWAMWVAN